MTQQLNSAATYPGDTRERGSKVNPDFQPVIASHCVMLFRSGRMENEGYPSE